MMVFFIDNLLFTVTVIILEINEMLYFRRVLRKYTVIYSDKLTYTCLKRLIVLSFGFFAVYFFILVTLLIIILTQDNPGIADCLDFNSNEKTLKIVILTLLAVISLIIMSHIYRIHKTI